MQGEGGGGSRKSQVSHVNHFCENKWKHNIHSDGLLKVVLYEVQFTIYDTCIRMDDMTDP